jgi:outer membrane receptor for ferrienterochelin and colicins
MKCCIYLASMILAFTAAIACAEAETSDRQEDNYFEMSLEDLMNVEVDSGASLTVTTRRTAPGTVTTITREEIARSGARSMYELFDIYITNFQNIAHSSKVRHMGLRGIISNRDDKFLLLVNGRVMNEKTDFGVQSERDLPMLSDIHHIDVVRGPGSTLYGPGALAMVINVVTENALTFQGFEMTNKLGAIEEFYSSEVKYGRKFTEDSGIYLYYGMAKYLGASMDNAPIIPGGPWETDAESIVGEQFVTGGDELTSPYQDYNSSFRDLGKFKAHGQYTNGGLDIWARFTSGGEYIDFIRTRNGDPWNREGEGYRQGTINGSYKYDLTDDFSIRTDFGFDTTEIETENYVWKPKSYRENEYHTKIQANWNINKSHSVAFGGEWSHEQFGRRHSNDQGGAYYYLMGSCTRKAFEDCEEMPRWSTDMMSAFGEYQFKINEQLTSFLGGRIDHHPFVGNMFSPRASLVYMPTQKDTLKLMAARSVRTNTAAEMKLDDMSGQQSEPEILKSIELRYEHQQNSNLLLAGGFFYHWHNVIGWSDTDGSSPIGDMNTYGLEAEAKYHTKNTTIILSHGYTKLDSFVLGDGQTSTELTASPMGYGNDLANWDNHVSKFVVQHNLTEKLNVDSSLICYWGCPGGQDYANYMLYGSGDDAVSYNPGFDEAFRPSLFFNLALGYKFSENLSLRVDGYNLLGIFDQELNKRRVGFNNNYPAEYREQPTAIAVTVTCRF